MDFKERIIQNAAKCFTRYGYNKTTMDDIGKSVGLKKNSLYHYFKNKEEIFFAVLINEQQHVNNNFYKQLKEIKGIKNKILGYVKLKLDICKEESILFSAMSELMVPEHSLYERIIFYLFEIEIVSLEKMLKEAYDNKEVKQIDFRMFSESMMMIFNSIKKLEISHQSVSSPFKNKTLNDYIIFIFESMLDSIIE